MNDTKTTQATILPLFFFSSRFRPDALLYSFMYMNDYLHRMNISQKYGLHADAKRHCDAMKAAHAKMVKVIISRHVPTFISVIMIIEKPHP